MSLIKANLFISFLVFFYNLYNNAVRDQTYPTPATEKEALYNLFIRDNDFLPFIVVYLLISLFLYFHMRQKKQGAQM
ncbi:MAG TPA: hypothetical protein DDY49_10925 [Paenibacillaceae bacterium]|mgnify:CR=1 FL=1|nr:hypothetical protein [Paenibacillaceae bacterium]